jgi:hypothetical protein
MYPIISSGNARTSEKTAYAKISENRRHMNSMKMRAAVASEPRQLIVAEIL